MYPVHPISIHPFQPQDQDEAKALVLAGMVEHWGFLDPTLNPDLNDIGVSYADGLFLVARQDGRLVGTGAFQPREENAVEIKRMSVAADLRRSGLGGAILSRLCEAAKTRGYQKVILETTSSWQDVVAFYQKYGFSITHQLDDETYFKLDLAM